MVLFVIWIIGILTVVILVLKSSLRLYKIKKSALPLQNREVRKLYESCLKEMNVTAKIPLYSTAFLISPIITGFIRPLIYLPIRLITDFKTEKIRYMLLHEHQHYWHKDNISNYLLLPAGILYWFNPLVWYAAGTMRSDREVACDSAVLNMLDEDSYQDYGYTLISFAEKISFSPFSFTSSLGGTMKQLEQRILSIAGYKKPFHLNKIFSITIFTVLAVLFAGITPVAASYAADNNQYQWDSSGKNISSLDLSDYFEGYEGSFVLYDALFALEEEIITPKNSCLTWDQKDYPFEAWEQDQTLQSAMSGSVNWYFENLDQQIGINTIRNDIQKIHYGNETVGSDLSSYWMESVLKISPVEQVELLKDFCRNTFHFTPENIQAESKAAGSNAA